MKDGEMLVFVEVKALRSLDSEPQRKVNHEKRRRIITTAKAFIARHNLYDNPARFDIVTVKLNSENQPVIEHEADAFHAR
jgi:Holliday junction resolvase-like predicted endonuclease